MNDTVNTFQFGTKQLDLTCPQIMGILNVTPDSFSDGGHFNQFDQALQQVDSMVKAGATLIDVGGESTRPGASDVSVEAELQRVIPVIQAIKQRFDIIVSLDTSKAQVMTEGIANGVGLINDVRALQNTGCVDAVANSNVAVCLMHMQGLPRTMQVNPQYDDLLADIIKFFQQRISACEQAGINQNRVIIDPGYGFGKSLEQNYQLLANQQQLLALGSPLLAGVSRKSMIGNLLGRDVAERLAGSLSAAVLAALNGAKIIRVHDVLETADALRVLQTTLQHNNTTT